MGLLTRTSFAFLLGVLAASPAFASFCEWSLSESELRYEASVVRINSDGTEEIDGQPADVHRERIERERKIQEERDRERRREEEEYWRRRQPIPRIERQEDQEKQKRRDPIPGVDFPMPQEAPTTPKKDSYLN